MNENSGKTIEVIVRVKTGCLKDEVAPPWTISESDEWFTDIKIYSGTSDDEIGLVMFAACLSSSVASSDEIIKKTALETLGLFVSDEGFVLSGGLIFKENDEVLMSPKCCCGLEDWNTWLDVPKGETRIWNGHDPFACVEISDGKIKIWEDTNLRNQNSSIEFPIKEFIEKMKFVEKDLKDFLIRLGQWTKNIAPALEKEVVNHFAENMHIEV